jgi:hypothetical protein
MLLLVSGPSEMQSFTQSRSRTKSVGREALSHFGCAAAASITYYAI